MEADGLIPFPHLLSDFHHVSTLPLFDCIIRDDLESLQDLISDDSRCVNQADDDELTPLHLAVEMGKEQMVKMLIENGADINHRTLDLRMSPLHLSVRNGSMVITDLLLSNGADINIRNKIDHTPLHVAVVTNNIEMIRLLIIFNANVDAVTSDQRKESPVLKASTISLEITRLLLDAGAKLTQDLKEVHVAILANKPDIALFLLNSVDGSKSGMIKHKLVPNRIGRTHLQSVASHVLNCDPSTAVLLMKRLIDLGSDVNHNNIFGTVFHILISRGEDPVSIKCMDYLLTLDNINCDMMSPVGVPSTYMTPLCLAFRLGHFNYGMKLIKSGYADVRLVNLEYFKFKPGAGDLLKLAYINGLTFDHTFRDSCKSIVPLDMEHEKEFEEICSWIEIKSGEILPLKNLIRIHLRNIYRQKTPRILENLKIPKILVDFLLFESI